MDIKLIVILSSLLAIQGGYASEKMQKGVEICDRFISELDKIEQTNSVLELKKYVSDLKQQLSRTKNIKINDSISSDLTQIPYDEQIEKAKQLDDSLIDQPPHENVSELIQEIKENYEGTTS